jgi:2-keto-3-deoxy-L-rhamnonate aldolase RhmA
MKSIRKRVRAGETLLGCFLNLGSSVSAEIVGLAEFDWVLIDLEHGAGFEKDVLFQLQALEHTSAAAVIRVEGLERQRFHRMLDLGAHGIMVPRIDNADEARAAVAAMRYQPVGVRGVAQINRACGFGNDFKNYFASANDSLLTVIQIETEESLRNLDAIAATDGVDVLFVGPTDLSQSLGIFGQLDHPKFMDAVKAVGEAARRFDKAAGTLLKSQEDFRKYWEFGYRFIACGSDGGLLNTSARRLATDLKTESRNCAARG